MKAERSYLFMLGNFWGFATASFHNNFTNIRRHTDLLLEWDHADAIAYPLVIHVRVFNRTDDHKVNTFETNISTGITDNSFPWDDLPSPLPFFATATYELQVLPQEQIGSTVSDLVIASSTPFYILPENEEEDGSSGWPTTINGTASQPSEPANSSHSDGRPSSSTAIAAGLVVPFVVGISVFVFLCMQRRRKRTLEERRKERETLVID
ncbi:hypothetical protein F5Y01DRAFT_305158 [Xylaria sp. FL0043]|nr:hypothetical protein F5Y01DRAFT_305158 [Xylaria sp. FL0043]